MFTTARVAVSDTPTKISDHRFSREVAVRADVDVYLGGEDLTEDNGFLLTAGEMISVPLDFYHHLYAMAVDGEGQISLMTRNVVG